MDENNLIQVDEQEFSITTVEKWKEHEKQRRLTFALVMKERRKLKMLSDIDEEKSAIKDHEDRGSVTGSHALQNFSTKETNRSKVDSSIVSNKSFKNSNSSPSRGLRN